MDLGSDLLLEVFLTNLSSDYDTTMSIEPKRKVCEKFALKNLESNFLLNSNFNNPL